MNLQIFFFCPVPENQKPLTEFILFQQNSFFSKIFFSKIYPKKNIYLLCFFLLVFSLTLPFSNFFFLFDFFLFFFFFFLFFRWSIIEKKFNDSRLVYEEGSWYDGQIWDKPLSLIKNERLISSQIIQPFLEKMSFFLIFLVFFTLFLYSF
jgi:hypothetical protein